MKSKMNEYLNCGLCQHFKKFEVPDHYGWEGECELLHINRNLSSLGCRHTTILKSEKARA